MQAHQLQQTQGAISQARSSSCSISEALAAGMHAFLGQQVTNPAAVTLRPVTHCTQRADWCILLRAIQQHLAALTQRQGALVLPLLLPERSPRSLCQG
jgi:hypothetical protein